MQHRTTGILWTSCGCTFCLCFGARFRTDNISGGIVSHANIALGAHQAGAMEPSPFSIPSKKLAMWLFIISDAMSFAACLVAYGFLRNSTPNWPTPFHSITNVAIMTFILLTSSLTMLIGLRAAKAGDKATG